MSTSEWKCRANSRNSAKSTGPQTDAGKERSRANSCQHGLSGEGVVVPPSEAEAIATRREMWRGGYQIDTPLQEWAFEQLVVNSIRIDICQANQQAVIENEKARAARVWDIDRAADAAVLGDRISRKPETVAKQLRQSKYGCEWLMDQWCALGLALDSGVWTDEQVQRALDLRGVAGHARDDFSIDDPADFADREYAELVTHLKEGLDDLDERDRVAAMKGFSRRPSKDLARLQRYESACWKRYHEARKMLQVKAFQTMEVIAKPEPIEESPPEPPRPDPVAIEAAEKAAIVRQFLALDAARDADYMAEMGYPMPSVSLSDAVANTPAQPAAQPLNRRQRKALARQQARNAK